MTTHDTRRECPDWVCQPARCICGGPEWEPECTHQELPQGITLGEN